MLQDLQWQHVKERRCEISVLANTQQYKNSFFVATVPQWNTLPQSAVNADSVSVFKTQLRSMP